LLAPDNDVDEIRFHFPLGVLEIPIDRNAKRRDGNSSASDPQFRIGHQPPDENHSIQHAGSPLCYSAVFTSSVSLEIGSRASSDRASTAAASRAADSAAACFRRGQLRFGFLFGQFRPARGLRGPSACPLPSSPSERR
jgi:hypothetical protein